MSTARRTSREFRPGLDRCESLLLLSAGALTPAQVRQAYAENFNFAVNGESYAANGSGQTIAIVIAGLDPTIGSDLATFDRAYNLPTPNFQSVYFNGAQNNISPDGTEETSIDVEWSHAVAPGANILLVQAASGSESDLMAAVNYAREQPGVSVVSMSWGWHESTADLPYNAILTTPAGHTGVTFVAASGDTGAWTHPYGNTSQLQFGVSWPAANPNVLSVGGTRLSLTSTGNYGSETAWDEPGGASGGGISTIYAEPSYQRGVQSTGYRTVPDVSYDADSTASPISVYDSYVGGWIEEGGTSIGAPQWAGLIAIANQGRALVHLNPLDGASQTLPAIYQFSSALHDVVGGSNGYYNAVRGYDEVTGLGSPDAIQLVGDLSFNVPSNYLASHVATAAVPVTSTGAGLDSAAGFDFASPGTQEFNRPASPATGTQAGSTTDDESFLMPLTAVASQPATRRGLHDMALESILGEVDAIALD